MSADSISALALVLGPVAIGALVAALIYWLRQR
jgi:hypothetical protein